MQALKIHLQNRLQSSRRIAIVGIGAEVRGDDVCGMLIAQHIEKHLSRRTSHIKVFLGSTAPENLTGEIRKFKPTHIVMIDAAQIKGVRAQAILFTPQEMDEVSFCTHRLPLSVMAAYLQQSLSCEVMCVGVRSRSTAYNGPVSPEMKKRIKEVTAIMVDVLGMSVKHKKETYA